MRLADWRRGAQTDLDSVRVPQGQLQLRPQPDEVALPEGWSSAVSPDGRTYFYHAATRTTQWKPPAAEAAEAAALPPGWRRVQDARGRWYYFHKETRTTQWGPP